MKQYKRSYFDLNMKRIILLDEESKILQRAHGDADDFDDTVHLACTINQEQGKERESTS